MKRIFLILCFILLLSSTCFSQVAIDDVTESGEQSNETSWTFQHTCTGDDLVLTVGVFTWDIVAGNVTSVIYNGDPLQEIGYGMEYRTRAELWYMANPDTGGAYDIVVNFSHDVNYISIGAISFTGVDTDDPIGDSGTANDDSALASIILTTTVDGSMLVDVLGSSEEIDNFVGADQVSRWYTQNTIHSGQGSTEEAPTADDYTMSWSINPTSGDEWGYVAAVINAKAVLVVEPSALPITVSLLVPTVTNFEVVTPATETITLALLSPSIILPSRTKIQGATLQGVVIN